MRKRKVTEAALLLLSLALLFSCGGKETVKKVEVDRAPVEEKSARIIEEKGGKDVEPSYTYTDAVGQMPTNWNPHTYQTSADSAPSQYIRNGFYSFIFNDGLNPIEGKEDFSGYVIMPEMAEGMPQDVTEEVRKAHPEFGIPSSATSGYAYTIDLNREARWENGKKINAKTYIDSMQRLLDPRLLNYRATEMYKNNLAIAGAENYANHGQTVIATLRTVMKNEGVKDVEEFLKSHASDEAYINWSYSFDGEYDFAANKNNAFNPDGFVPSGDETKGTGMDLSAFADFFIDAIAFTDDLEVEEAEKRILDEIYLNWTYPTGLSFDTVGLYESGEYQITIVLSKSLSGFQLLYSLTSTWLVEPELYDACLRESNGVWTSTYNTSVDTTLSYGPYRITYYQTDKAMRYERNPEWYGWTDGRHVYEDPISGEVLDMYQTTAVDVQKVEEASTQKLMFLKGELMTYNLQADDFAQYRTSEYCHTIPDETIFFLILNGHEEAIRRREAASDFNRATQDIETLLVPAFRKAVAVTYDKELFAATISPQRSGAYGIIGTSYIYDPETGARYRDTDQAKKVLADFYSVDVSSFDSLDSAVDSITGFDAVKARELYAEAFDEALSRGYITDNDNDGISDQTVTIEYCLSSDNAFMTKTIDYLNEKMNEVTKGTPFENRVKFIKSAPYGNEWSNKIKSGLSDTVLGGWTGSLLNPFGLTDLYTNPAKQYDGAWFDASSVKLTLSLPVEGEMRSITMSLKAWSDALNGETVVVDDVEYNFGEGQADVSVRLDILAAIEGEVLKTYDYLPLLQNAGMILLSQKAYYVVDEYNPIMGYGGIAYLRYDYDDASWNEYVASVGGTLKY